MNFSKNQFLKIIDEHQKIITSLCSVYYKNLEDRHDARQDVILQLWKSFPTYRGDAEVSTWIYRVSLNTILSKKRKERRRPISEPIDPDKETIRAYKSGADDTLQLFNRLLNALDDLDRAVIILHLEGYKNIEIAEMLGVSQTNVSTKLYRIKVELRRKLKMYNDEFKQI